MSSGVESRKLKALLNLKCGDLRENTLSRTCFVSSTTGIETLVSLCKESNVVVHICSPSAEETE